ncbi:hypothetical protein HHI36_017613 [Cryptolaemus montrouzieri]|uniref:Uncharacterized protein n=1 Tax=Cryptolaemus montrouzieri TaxID=559131 RepID=A0ABD2NNV6_9CUCU
MNFFREKPKKDEPKQTGFGFSFGNSRNTVEKPSLGLPSFGTSKNNILGGLSSVGSKVGTDLQKVGSGVQQTGKKALDIFFGSGRGKSESSSSGLSLGAETHSKAGFPNLSLGGSSLPHPSGNIGGPLGSVNFNSTSLDVNLKGPKDNGGLGNGKHELSSPGISFGGSQGLPGLSIGGPSLPHPSGSLEGPLGNVNFNSTSLDVNLKGPKDIGVGFPKIPSVGGLGKGAETHGKAGFPNLSLGGASLPHPSGSIEGPLGSVNLNSTSLDINLKGPKDIGVGFPKIPSVGGLGKGAETHGKAGFPNLSLGGASLPHPSGSIEGPLGSVNFNSTSLDINLKGPKDNGIGLPKIPSIGGLGNGKHELSSPGISLGGSHGLPSLSIGGPSLPHPSGNIEGPLGSVNLNSTSLDINLKGPKDIGVGFPKIPSVGGLGKGAETHGKAGFPNLSLGGASLPHPSGSIEGPLGSVNFNITSMNVNLKGPKDDVTSNVTLNTGKHGLAKIEGSADGNTTSLNIDLKGPQDGGTTFLPNTAIELKSVSIGAKTGKKHHVTSTVGGLIEGTQGKPGKHLLDISTNNSHNNKNLTLPQVSNQIGGLGSGVNIISVPTKEQLPGTISLDNQINRGIGVPDLSLGQQGILKPSGNIEGESATIQSNLEGTTDNSREELKL